VCVQTLRRVKWQAGSDKIGADFRERSKFIMEEGKWMYQGGDVDFDPQVPTLSDACLCDACLCDACPWAHGGEGASAPSCRAPQGHDQTPCHFMKSFFSHPFSTCGSRKSTKSPLATENCVASERKCPLAAAATRNFPKKMIYYDECPKKCLSQVGFCSTCGCRKSKKMEEKLTEQRISVV